MLTLVELQLAILCDRDAGYPCRAHRELQVLFTHL